MVPPHTRVCGWRDITTFLACVIRLGETGSSLIPTRCDDTTGNHPNHLLLRFRAYALNSQLLQTREERGEAGAGPGTETAQKAVAAFG